MKNIQNIWRMHQVKLLIFTLLLGFASACLVGQSQEPARIENAADKSEVIKQETSSETTEIKTISESADINEVADINTISCLKTATDITENSTEDPRIKICKKYAACGCQSYKSCMEDLENDPTPDEPGILECILNSSCKSLCAGKPDCGGNRPGSNQPKRSNCSQIRCNKDSDCPGDCYGGCSEGRCYSF